MNLILHCFISQLFGRGNPPENKQRRIFYWREWTQESEWMAVSSCQKSGRHIAGFQSMVVPFHHQSNLGNLLWNVMGGNNSINKTILEARNYDLLFLEFINVFESLRFSLNEPENVLDWFFWMSSIIRLVILLEYLNAKNYKFWK